MADPISWKTPLAWLPPVGGFVLIGLAALSARDGWGAASTGALLVAAAGLLIAPLVAHRLEGVMREKDGSWKLVFGEAEKASPKAARWLVENGLLTLASHYQFVHSELADEKYRDAKVHLQDRLVERAAEAALEATLEAKEVQKLATSGSPIMRVLALGLMKGNPALSSTEAIVSSMTNSATGNEQYHALALARDSWPRLDAEARQRVAETASNIDVHGDSDRQRLVAGILELARVG